MANYGAKVSRKNINVRLPLTEANKRFFSLLSITDSLLIIKAFGGNYSGRETYQHDLDMLPNVFAFSTDDLENPTSWSFGYLRQVSKTECQVGGSGDVYNVISVIPEDV